jgi:hypothetical protein
MRSAAAQRQLLPVDRKREREHEMLAAAGSSPRDMMQKGDADWCWSALLHLRTIWASEKSTIEMWERTIADIRSACAWEKVPKGRPYGTEDAMLRDVLGVELSEAERTITDRAARIAAAAKETGEKASPGPTKAETAAKKKRGKTGAFTTTDKISCGETSAASKYGTSAEYQASRLKRDFPEIATRLANGEFPSVRAAAMEAGIVKPVDPVKRVMRLVKAMNTPDLQCLRVELFEFFRRSGVGQ